MLTKLDIDQLSVDTIRTLSIDAINSANSGHPGLPMGAAPMAYALWGKLLSTIRRMPNGSTATGLYYQQVTVRPCFTAFCTCRAIRYLLRI